MSNGGFDGAPRRFLAALRAAAERATDRCARCADRSARCFPLHTRAVARRGAWRCACSNPLPRPGARMRPRTARLRRVPDPRRRRSRRAGDARRVRHRGADRGFRHRRRRPADTCACAARAASTSTRTRVRDNGLLVADVDWCEADPDDELRPEHALLRPDAASASSNRSAANTPSAAGALRRCRVGRLAAGRIAAAAGLAAPGAAAAGRSARAPRLAAALDQLIEPAWLSVRARAAPADRSRDARRDRLRQASRGPSRNCACDMPPSATGRHSPKTLSGLRVVQGLRRAEPQRRRRRQAAPARATGAARSARSGRSRVAAAARLPGAVERGRQHRLLRGRPVVVEQAERRDPVRLRLHAPALARAARAAAAPAGRRPAGPAASGARRRVRCAARAGAPSRAVHQRLASTSVRGRRLGREFAPAVASTAARRMPQRRDREHAVESRARAGRIQNERATWRR